MRDRLATDHYLARPHQTLNFLGDWFTLHIDHSDRRFVEFRRDARDGALVLIEINARTGFGQECVAHSGLNVPLIAYRDAGADCVYAPGLNTTEQIRAVVDAVGVPVNVLAWPGGPSVPEIGEAGGRRVSTGGSLASTAYGALMIGARELLESGTSTYLAVRLQPSDRANLQ